MGLAMEGRGHTPSVDNAPFESAGMIMVVRVNCASYVPECYTPQCKERSIPQAGEGMIMLVRVCVLC